MYLTMLTTTESIDDVVRHPHRLKGLQKDIRAGKLPTVRKLTRVTSKTVDPGIDYEMARYLCVWLQEKGLLEKCYRQCLANSRSDPTGYRTLQRTLGAADMAAFEKQWAKWVLSLGREGS